MEEDTQASDIIYCQHKGAPLLKVPAQPTAQSKHVREGMRGHKDCSGMPPPPKSSAQQLVSNVSSRCQRLRVGEVRRPSTCSLSQVP